MITAHFQTEMLKTTKELDLDVRCSKETLVIREQKAERAQRV